MYIYNSLQNKITGKKSYSNTDLLYNFTIFFIRANNFHKYISKINVIRKKTNYMSLTWNNKINKDYVVTIEFFQMLVVI